MNRASLLIILLVGLLLLFAIGGFESHDSKPENRPAGSATPLPRSSIVRDDKDTARNKESATNSAAQSEIGEDDGSDPDLGEFQGKIDHEQYLRMRDEFVALKRGIESGHPIDPQARGRAIELMQDQESNLSGKNS